MINTHISANTAPSPPALFDQIFMYQKTYYLKINFFAFSFFLLLIFKENVRIDVNACGECQAAEAVWKSEGKAEIRG